MTTHIPASKSATSTGSRRVVKVSAATIAAARAQVAISKTLGRPVPVAVSKIARIG